METPSNTDTMTFPFVSVLTGFYCISERSVLAGNSTILMSQMVPTQTLLTENSLIVKYHETTK